MTFNDILLPTLGGVLIGLSAGIILLTHGRIAGISGITASSFLPNTTDRAWRIAFLLGLIGVGGLLSVLMPEMFPTAAPRSTPLIIAAGLLVGFGTRLGSGCTSGHGVCGISRLSPRSIVATLVFMATGMITVTALRFL